MRVNYGDFLRSRNPESSAQASTPNETIYYLRTSTPHLHDISVLGPYHSIEALVAQAVHNFGDECASGVEALQDFAKEGMLDAFGHITSPINNDPNKVKTIRVIKEQNSAMAATLPGPTWYILSTDIDPALAYATIRGSSLDALVGLAYAAMERSGPALLPVEDMMVHGTFGDATAAIEAARRLAHELASRIGGGQDEDY
ncbi:hypothetical protein LTR08_000139 [Meristemomyces frigidus]|nr:hypothetical protein LTR08_000139 [Meristemomyces frigidus]